MLRPAANYAFIDSQNLHLGVKSLGWVLDWKKFRIYLREKYAVGTAYMFLGFMAEQGHMYSYLQKTGFVMKFKPVVPNRAGDVKGNIDADLVLQAMIDRDKYDKAVIVTSDGDFYSLAGYLREKGKLEIVLSPYRGTCSTLLIKAAQDKIAFLDRLKPKLELIKRKSSA